MTPVFRTLSRWLTAGRSHLVDVAFPPECALCQVDLPDSSELWCEPCRAKLTQELTLRCVRCGAPAPLPIPAGERCPACVGTALAFDSIVVFGSYADGLRHAVLLMKRGQREPLSLAMGRWLVARLETDLRALSIDTIVPVPMYWLRRLWRGTNNPDLLAESLSNQLGVPFDPRCLVRVRSTEQQSLLPASERPANVRGAFRLRGSRDIVGKTLLVVDDILTTGATCHEAAKVLKQAGAKAVHVCVVARAKSARS